MHVGDGRQTDFKALLSLFQLAIDGGLLGLRGFQIGGRRQGTEIGLCHAHDQVVQRGIVAGRQTGLTGAGAAQSSVVGLAVNGLGELQTIRARGGIAIAICAAEAHGTVRLRNRGDLRATAVGVTQACAAAQVGQQRGARLHHTFACGIHGRLGSGQLRITGAGHFVDLGQVSSAGAAGEGREAGDQGNGQGMATHGKPLGIIVRIRSGTRAAHRADRVGRSRTGSWLRRSLGPGVSTPRHSSPATCHGPRTTGRRA